MACALSCAFLLNTYCDPSITQIEYEDEDHSDSTFSISLDSKTSSVSSDSDTESYDSSSQEISSRKLKKISQLSTKPLNAALLRKVKEFLFIPRTIEKDWCRTLFEKRVYRKKKEAFQAILQLTKQGAKFPVKYKPRIYKLGFIELDVINDFHSNDLLLSIIKKFLPFLEKPFSVSCGLGLKGKNYADIRNVLKECGFEIIKAGSYS